MVRGKSSDVMAPRSCRAPVAFYAHPAIQTFRPLSNSAASKIHVATRGQFAKRLRPANLLHGDKPLSSPNSTTEQTSQTLTPTATLLASISSIASTGAGIFLLGFIIFVHESGHFLAARLQNIRVKNFSIGFGPKVVNYTPKNSETEFTVRLLPLGGYVAFPEHTTVTESGETKTDDDPDLLQNRPILDRAAVISAGVVANLILAWASIFASVSSVGLPTYVFRPGVTIAQVVDPSGAAAKAGIIEGDVILSVNGNSTPQSLDSASAVAEQIRTSKGKPLTFRIQRGDTVFPLQVRPSCCSPDGSSAMGVQLIPNASVSRIRPKNTLGAFQTTNSEFSRLSQQTWLGLTSIFANFQSSTKQLSGPIGVVSMGADLARNDAAALLTFCAVISINLALINSLPLPALDGGQMTFLIIEALRGTPVSLRVQDAINRTALLLFLAFSGVLFFGDLEKLNIVGVIRKLFG